MNLRFRTLARSLPAALAGGLLLGSLLLAGCRHDAVVVPAPDNYFPTVVGTYRSYAVQDSTWMAGKVSVSQFQFRERVSEQFSDATGQPAYRLIRSRRADANQAWVDDSVLVVQPLPRAVLLTRNNVRTVELLYPPQAGKGWNQYALTVNGQATTYQLVDTITAITRHYGATVGATYTTPAAGAAPAKTYDATVPVLDTEPVGINDGLLRQSGYQQVFARGVGPVLRRRYYYETFTKAANGAETVTVGIIQNGTSRRETLLETGTI